MNLKCVLEIVNAKVLTQYLINRVNRLDLVVEFFLLLKNWGFLGNRLIRSPSLMNFYDFLERHSFIVSISVVKRLIDPSIGAVGNFFEATLLGDNDSPVIGYDPVFNQFQTIRGGSFKGPLGAIEQLVFSLNNKAFVSFDKKEHIKIKQIVLED